ncbi:hypothetical protein GCM10010519_64570 [Streptomyces lactacystinicus]
MALLPVTEAGEADVDAAQGEVAADAVQGEAPGGDRGAQGEVEGSRAQGGGEVGWVAPVDGGLLGRACGCAGVRVCGRSGADGWDGPPVDREYSHRCGGLSPVRACCAGVPGASFTSAPARSHPGPGRTEAR